jgi:teichuronic acid exporter
MTPEGPTSDEERRSLDVKFAGGLAWTAGAKWATQAITWVSLGIVARLLSTADYGVGEMAGTMSIVSNVLAEFGVGTAVLHMPELSRKALAQLHTFSILMCTGVFVLAAMASPFVASFYHSTHVSFFVANNLGLFVTGFQAVPMGLLSRDMDYRRLSLVEATMVIVQSVVVVITAWLGWGYWALFAGGAAGKITAGIMVCSWKHVGFAWPRWNDIRASVKLGRQAAIGRLAWSLYSQADGIVVGRVLGPSVLGVYRMAMNLASAPAEKVSTLLMRTVTPLFANVQFDLALVRRYYMIVTETLTLIVVPLMLGLIIVAQAVPLLLGKQWAPAIAPMRWLAVFMILRTLGTLTEQVLISQRLTRFTMRMSILNFVVMPVAFFFAARWQGTSGVAMAWIALSPVTIFPMLFVLLRHIEMPWREYADAILPSAAGTTVMCLALLGLDRWLQSYAWPTSVRLAALVALGGVVYGGVMFIFFRQRIARYVNFLSGLRRKTAPLPA